VHADEFALQVMSEVSRCLQSCQAVAGRVEGNQDALEVRIAFCVSHLYSS
jgi:hypothetical protein